VNFHFTFYFFFPNKISIFSLFSKFQLHLQRYSLKHPGGQDILLGVLGRDASVEFETMRHSAIALQQLERYLEPGKWEGKHLENVKVQKTDGFFRVDTGDHNQFLFGLVFLRRRFCWSRIMAIWKK